MKNVTCLPALSVFLAASMASAATVATTTTLAVTSGGNAVTTVAAGSVITLTATVKAGATLITPGRVTFCDTLPATNYTTGCTDIKLDISLLGTSQLIGTPKAGTGFTTGTAVLRFIPGIGAHNYEAYFLGANTTTTTYSPSLSAAAPLTVTGVTEVTTTTITHSGTVGNYTLTASVSDPSIYAPTGTVDFLDTSNANYQLGTTDLTGDELSLNWPSADSHSTALSALPASIAGVEGDFNLDGIPDLAVITSSYLGAGTVSFLLGTGTGTFTKAAGTAPTVGTGPYSIAVGDFNNDGIPDLAVANSGSRTVTILLGTGTGGFTKYATSPATGTAPDAIAVGDFNGDGNADLAVVNKGTGTANGSVTILLGKGTGAFTAVTPTLATGRAPTAIAVGDFNGDGIPDLAITNGTTDTVTIWLGTGLAAGTFTAAAVSPATGTDPKSIVAADFTGNGILDLAAVNGTSENLTILMGNGNGTFTAAASPDTSTYPNALAVGDFNGDGKPDLAVINGETITTEDLLILIIDSLLGIPDTLDINPGAVSVMFGNGDGTFTAAPNSPVAVDYGPMQVVAADFNSDGLSDFAALNTFATLPTITNITTDDGEIIVHLTEPTSTATASVGNISIVGTGSHLVDASYLGDTTLDPDAFGPSISSTIPLTAKPVATTLTLAANPPAGSLYEHPVIFTAILTPDLAQNHNATGTVTFYNGTTNLGTGTIANGVATLTTSALPYGNDSITAVYSGDTNFATSTSSALSYLVTVVTYTSVTSSLNPAYWGDTVTFTATVSSDTITPTGTVSFFDDTTLLATETLVSGMASYTTGELSVGTHNITVDYYPDQVESIRALRGILAQVILFTDFNIAASPSSHTVYTGENATFTITLTPDTGFILPVAISCTQIPANTTCTFSATSIPGGNGTATLVVQTSPPSQAAAASGLPGKLRLPLLAGLLLLFIPRRWRRFRKGWPLLLALFAILATGVAITGCTAPGPLTGATPVGAQTITITGVATNGAQSLIHGANVTLNVQSLF